jgi:nitroreductase
MTDYTIDEFISRRWSPRSFQWESIDPAALRRCLEAARWAASCFNEQPWRYLVADRASDPEGHERLASCLVESNAAWATKAPVLLLACMRTHFAKNGKPNRHAAHDLGQASAQLALQAAAEDLYIHQMAGFDASRAREVCAVPEGHDPLVMIALGRLAPASELDEALRKREAAPRERRPQAEFVFGATFGEAPAF